MFNFGIVGAGSIGETHVYALKNNAECKIVGICDLDIDKANELSKVCDAKTYTDYKMMQENEKLDVVILNLPHFLHCIVSQYFLSNHVAVLVEKPMAINQDECVQMIESSKKYNTTLVVGHIQKYYECYREVRKIMQSKSLGKFCMMTEVRNIDYFTNRPRWFLNRKQAGGGIVMNYAAHTLDKLFYTTDLSVKEVYSVDNNFLTGDSVEATSQTLLKLSDDSTATFTYSGCHVPGLYETYFYFTDGVAKIENGTRLWISEMGKPFTLIDLNYNKDICEAQLNELLKHLKGTESEIVTAEYGMNIISVLDKIFKR